jgi:hypothetical protein
MILYNINIHGLDVHLLPLHYMLYIGETGRPLRTRFGEHRRAVISNDANQPVARHCNTGKHVRTVFQIWKFETAVPFLIATKAAN